MTDTLKQIREMVKFDSIEVSEEAVKLFCPFIRSMMSRSEAFDKGTELARFQHTKLTPIIDSLLKIVEMQGKALEFYKREHEHWKAHPMEQNKAHHTQAETEALLKGILDGNN